MTVWDTLGIPPTTDVAKIKKAFADKSKKHHPEDDPEGFIALRQAFRAAVAAAERQAAGRQDAGLEDMASAGSYRDIPENSVLAAPVVSGAPAAPDAPAPFVDFAGIEQRQALQMAEQRAFADAFIERVRGVYMDKKTRKSPEAWRALFADGAFAALQQSEYFTIRFLDFLMSHREFPKKVWNSTLEPVLHEWRYRWAGTSLWSYFGIACGFDGAGKKNTPVRQNFWPGLVAAALAIVMMSSYAFSESGKQDDLRRQRENNAALLAGVRSSLEEGGGTGVPSFDFLEGGTYKDALPLTEADWAAIKAEEEAQKQLTAHLEQQDGYEAAAETAGALEMPESAYNALLEQYKTLGGPVPGGEAVEDYCPKQRAIVNEKILPVLRQDIQNGVDPAKNAVERQSVGMTEMAYETLADVYAQQGEADLEEALAAYDRFAYTSAAFGLLPAPYVDSR